MQVESSTAQNQLLNIALQKIIPDPSKIKKSPAQNQQISLPQTDEVLQKIYSVIRQNSINIDAKSLEKIKSLCQKFGDDKKLAAELITILKSKNIEPTFENVEHLIEIVKNDEKHHEGKKNQQEDKNKNKQNDDEQMLSSIYSQKIEENFNVLTVLNHLKNSNGSDFHWIYLPFTWETPKFNAGGMIQILTNTALKTTEKIQIKCDLPFTKYNFVVYLKDSKVKEIRFCSLPSLLAKDIKKTEERLGELFSSGMSLNYSVPVTYSALTLIEDFSAVSLEKQGIDTTI